MRSNLPRDVVVEERDLPTTLPNKPFSQDDHRGLWLWHFEFKGYGKQRSTPEKFDRYDERLYQ